jgi:hypothetical protein
LSQLAQVLKFRALGPWGPGEVKCAWGQSTFAPPITVQHEIDRAWSTMGQKPGVHLFDGKMCRLEWLWMNSNELGMELSETSYKNFVGTNMHNPHFAAQYGQKAMANPLGISVALISADGFLVMGRRNERVAYYPGRIHPFAGALEPEDGLEIFKAVERELNEELGLAAIEIRRMICLGMAEDRGLAQPELILHGEAEKTLEELRSGVDEVEHDALVAIEARREVFELELEGAKLYTPKLARGKLYTPIALATILLCGREKFGNEWFDAVFQS